MITISTREHAGTRIGRITIDRPDKKNALTPAMLDQLREHLRTFDGGATLSGSSPAVGAIVLDGAGAAFCSGFDLSLCRDNSDALGLLLDGLAQVIRTMRECAAPIVLAAHGAAIAGGCALLGGADVVITHHEAKIGYPVVRLGISPAVSGPWLAQGVGFGRARELLLNPTLITGWDAYRIGLAHECIEDAGKVRDRAMAVAEQLASKPRCGVVATKRWLNELTRANDAVDLALHTSLTLVGSPEERERLAALWKS